MKFVERFKKSGKQGIVGVFNKDDKPLIFKMPKTVSYLAKHEYIVAKGLNEVRKYCPHFCYTLGMSEKKIDSHLPGDRFP